MERRLFVTLPLQMLVKKLHHHRPQVFLNGLEMEGVRGAFDDFEVMLDAVFFQGGGEGF